MKTVSKPVAHKNEIVGQVDVTIYETIDELQEHETVEHILNMFNKQNVIRLQANERAKHTEGRQTKGKYMMEAYNTLTRDEIATFTDGQPNRYAEMQEFLVSDAVKARVEARRFQRP